MLRSSYHFVNCDISAIKSNYVKRGFFCIMKHIKTRFVDNLNRYLLKKKELSKRLKYD